MPCSVGLCSAGTADTDRLFGTARAWSVAQLVGTTVVVPSMSAGFLLGTAEPCSVVVLMASVGTADTVRSYSVGFGTVGMPLGTLGAEPS